MRKLSDIAGAKRLVLKIGSSLLVENGAPRDAWLDDIAAEIARLANAGCQVIVVSSGAIALGAAKLDMPHGGRGSLADAQAAAAVGQIGLARLWAQALGRHDLTAAQILLSLDDLEDRRRYLNASATLERLLESGAIPVVNENDTVATEEIRFGDNDRLAARVAQAAGAEVVVLLSDVDGLYDRPPHDPEAKLVKSVETVTPDIAAMADSGSSSGLGSGGMVAKLQAAQIAQRAGIALAIVDGRCTGPLAAAVKNDRGTIFLPQAGDGARKAWLGGRLVSKGAICIDQGCAQALADGASLLAVGITSVEGHFERGDLVQVRGPDDTTLAQGLSEYDAVNCRRIAGLRDKEQAKILGHAPRSAVIHRDHMVLL